MEGTTNITPEEHRGAIQSLLGDPKNPRHAARVVELAHRDPRGSHAAHRQVRPHAQRAHDGEFVQNNLRMRQPAGVFAPRSVDELAGVVQRAADEGVPIKPIGGAWALSDVDATLGYLLDLGRHMHRVSRAEARSAGGEVLYEVEAGASIDQVNAALWADGFALLNQPGFGGLSLVGVASVGGHGSGQGIAGIAESIRSIRVLSFGKDGRVKRWQVEPARGVTDPAGLAPASGFELRQDDDAFRSLAVGLGALGVICSVVIAVQPAFHLREDREYLPWGEVAKRLEGLRHPPPGDDLHSFAVWLNPYPDAARSEPTCVLSTYRRVPGPPEGERGIGVVFGGSNLLADVVVWWVSVSPESLPALMDAALKSTGDAGVVMRCTEALSFGPPNHLHVEASACGIDAADTSRAVGLIVELAAKMAKRGDYVTSPVGLRFVAPGKAYLSPQFERETCMIEMPVLAGTAHAEGALSEFLDVMLRELGARPHWGQRLDLDETRAAKLYPKFGVFKAIAEEFGAAARFSNKRLAALGLSRNVEGKGHVRPALLLGESEPRWTSLMAAKERGPMVAVAVVGIVLLLWGYHGTAPLLSAAWSRYVGPGTDPGSRPSLLPGIAWDQELVSFVVGALVCVGLPAALLGGVLHRPLSSYGLGLPPRGRARFAWLAALGMVAVFALPFYFGAGLPQMRAVYPLFRGTLHGADLAAYEASTLLFILALEGALRGFLLFGVAPLDGGDEYPAIALAVETLVQTVWHFGKPVMEATGAPIWGVVAGIVAYKGRSVWPVVLAHWALIVIVDLGALWQ